MTAATAYAPAADRLFARRLVAFGGGIAAVALILSLSWRRGLDPVSVVLSGMVVALIAAAASATADPRQGRICAFAVHLGRRLAGPAELGCGDRARPAPRRSAAPPRLLLLRPLAILGLDDSGARSLGLALHATRFAVLALAVWLAATVTAEVGVIGFVGLAAPALARLCRRAHARAEADRRAAASARSCLSLTDSAGATARLRLGGDLAPTGAATALLGGPLLLWLLPRLRMSAHGRRSPLCRSRAAPHRASVAALACLPAPRALFAALGACRSARARRLDLATGDALHGPLPFRAPRIGRGRRGRRACSARPASSSSALPPIRWRARKCSASAPAPGSGSRLRAHRRGRRAFAGMLARHRAAARSRCSLVMLADRRARPSSARSGCCSPASRMSALCMRRARPRDRARQHAVLRRCCAGCRGSTSRAGEFEAWTALVALHRADRAALASSARWLDILPLGDATARGARRTGRREPAGASSLAAVLTGARIAVRRAAELHRADRAASGPPARLRARRATSLSARS